MEKQTIGKSLDGAAGMNNQKNIENNKNNSSVVINRVTDKFPDSKLIIYAHSLLGDDTIVVQPAEIINVMQFLRYDKLLTFDMMIDLTVVDYLGNQQIHPYLSDLRARFEVVYHLYSIDKNHRLRVKAPLMEENAFINSITGIWGGANWFEREAWDLYGIVFQGHPNLRRILLYEEFEGHPLRKEYSKTKRQPLIGPRN